MFLPDVATYRKDFDETEYISLIKEDELLEKYNEFGKKLKIVSEKTLIMNQYTMKNI